MNNILPLEILLIEDNDQNAELTMRAMREYNMENKMVRLSEGEEAMDYFYSAHARNNKIPRLILLDIKLHGYSGLEMLKRLKSNESARAIPVGNFTSSTKEKDIQAWYHPCVNSFISKPVEFESFQNTMNTLGRHWLLMNRVP